MSRPAKPRLFDGVLLPDNLYPDARKRENYWRYLKPDGKWKIFSATLDDAVRMAGEANALRHEVVLGVNPANDRASLIYHVERYIAWRQEYDPALKEKASWSNRCNLLRSFAKDFTGVHVATLTLPVLRTWWERLSYHSQHNRRSEFNRLFNYLGGHGVVPRLDSNPFTTADDKPRLVERGRPKSKRQRLSLDQYWRIYRCAGDMGYECLQVAMAISLLTTMRIGDICSLTFVDHVASDGLRKTINKSAAQRGDINAAHLEWKFSSHPMLHSVIKRARELSLINMRCPNVVSHMPEQKRMGKTKQHICQLTPSRLTKIFGEVRDASGAIIVLDGQTPPTFHEVRSLASDRFRAQGYSITEVQQIMAHTDERVTKGYQAGHAIEWTPIDITLTDKVLGGEF